MMFRIRRTLTPVAADSLFSSLRMLRSQILHRQLDYVACAIAPLVARKATEKEPTAIVDYDERQFAFMACGGHGSSYHVCTTQCDMAPRTNKLRSPGRGRQHKSQKVIFGHCTADLRFLFFFCGLARRTFPLGVLGCRYAGFAAQQMAVHRDIAFGRVGVR